MQIIGGLVLTEMRQAVVVFNATPTIRGSVILVEAHWGRSIPDDLKVAKAILSVVYSPSVFDRWGDRYRREVVSKFLPNKPWLMMPQHVINWVEGVECQINQSGANN